MGRTVKHEPELAAKLMRLREAAGSCGCITLKTDTYSRDPPQFLRRTVLCELKCPIQSLWTFCGLSPPGNPPQDTSSLDTLFNTFQYYTKNKHIRMHFLVQIQVSMTNILDLFIIFFK